MSYKIIVVNKLPDFIDGLHFSIPFNIGVLQNLIGIYNSKPENDGIINGLDKDQIDDIRKPILKKVLGVNDIPEVSQYKNDVNIGDIFIIILESIRKIINHPDFCILNI